jgi:hypothetical protein
MAKFQRNAILTLYVSRATLVGGEAEWAAHEMDVVQVHFPALIKHARANKRHILLVNSIKGLGCALDG